MRRFLSILLLSLILLGCKGKGGSSFSFNKSLYTPTFAKGFEIFGADGASSSLIKVYNPWQGAEGVETSLLLLRDNEALPKDYVGEVLKGGINRVVVVSSSHVAIFNELGEVKKIVGVSGKEYISNSYIVENRDSIADIGYDSNVDYELLVSLKPDIVLLYGVNGANSMEKKLKELKIPFLYIGEYLEEHPLAKSEWIVVVAELLGCREQGERVYGEICKSYNSVKESIEVAKDLYRPKVMFNTPYGDSWIVPSANSYIVQLVNDAGGDVIYDYKKGNSSINIDLEQAYSLVSKSDFWINLSGVTSMAEVKERFPKFCNTKPVVNGGVYSYIKRINDMGGNDFWESGVINPHLIVRDLAKIFHPEILGSDIDFVYYGKLE